MKRIKIRALEGLSVFVVCLHVKGRFPVKYLSSRNEISDFNIYTATGCGCNCCHMGMDSQQNYSLDSFWNSSSASLEWICHEGTSGVAQARQHILTFGRSATNSESLLHSMYSRYSRCHRRCSHTYDCRRMQRLTFLLRLWCNVTKVRTSPAPPSSVVTVSDLICMVIIFGQTGLPASPRCHLLTLYEYVLCDH